MQAKPPLPPYGNEALKRTEVDALPGATLLEFGASWCGVCHRTSSLVAEAVGAHPQLRHVRVEDGPGRALGRSFRVKLWPTLIFLFDGEERARVVRPNAVAELDEGFALIEPAS